MTRDKRIRGEGTAFEIDPPEPEWLDPPRPCGHEWRNNDFACMDCIDKRIVDLESQLANAATRMRDRCVEKVKVWANAHKHAFVGHVIDELYKELESNDV